MRRFLGLLLVLSFFIITSCSENNCKDCDNCGDDSNDVTATGDDDVQTAEDKDTEVADETADEEKDEMIKDEDQEVEDNATDEEADDADVDENKCRVITLGDLWVDSYDDGADYTGEPGNVLGEQNLQDWIQIMFYDPADEPTEDIFDLTVGTYDLSTENNQNLDTCTECILVFEDFEEETEDDMGGPTKTYFQETGTIEVTEIKAGTSQAKGVINAKLVQVYLDMFSMSVIKVEGGECLEFVDESFDTFCTPDCTDKICGSDGCYNDCGECEDGYECNEDGTACNLIPDDDVMPDADTDA